MVTARQVNLPLGRAPLDVAALRAELVGSGRPLAALDVVERTGSTNADLLAAAERGAPDGSALVAEHQHTGRGRLGREWSSPPRASLTLSVFVRPVEVPADRLGWLPLLVGVSLLAVTRDLAEVPAVLKWPNDLLLGDEQAKGAGILAEVTSSKPVAVVLGIGLNVTTTAEELPAGATSLAVLGARCADRGVLLAAIVGQVMADVAAWRAAGGDPDRTGLLDAYRAACATLGRRVRIELPGESALLGVASDVDILGRLVVRDDAGGQRAIAAGDVLHLRPNP